MFQIGKRIALFLLVNILVMATISIIGMLVVQFFFHGQMPRGYSGLMVICALWGMGGAFISLLISRWMAKVMMGVEVIDANTSDPDEQALLSGTVLSGELARGRRHDGPVESRLASSDHGPRSHRR